MPTSETNAFEQVKDQLRATPKRWLVTGTAGFIGSHLLETLLRLGQKVTGLDNFSTGHQRNLDQVRQAVGEVAWSSFKFIEGDIQDLSTCQTACAEAQVVLHQAALGSVPRSLADPITSNAVNVGGFLNILVAARDASVERFVYAASSSTYGDHPGLPKVEELIGKPLSPYAVTKYVNELYANVFSRCYGLSCIGLRYFNVFGPRQDPNGAYAAVIPRWAAAMLQGEPICINGDGNTSRDFCYVANAVQANLLAALTRDTSAINQVYNVAVGDQTSLNQLRDLLSNALRCELPAMPAVLCEMRDFRPGDVRHSKADISKAAELLGYAPSHNISDGLTCTAKWFASR